MIGFIYGTDKYRIEQKIKELATEFGRRRDKQGLNIVYLDGVNIESEHLRQEVMTVPFLGEKKMIIVSGINSNRKHQNKVLDFLQTKKDIDNVLIFVEHTTDAKKPPTSTIFKYLSGMEYVWQYDQLTPIASEKWLSQYAQSNNIKIESAALRALVTSIGNDLQRLTTELAKLHAYRNGDIITKDDISELVSSATDGQIFKVIDALSAQDKALSLKLLTNYLNEGNHPLTLITMLNRQFILLLQIKGFDKQPATLAKEFRLHPFVAQKATTYAQRFSTEQLKGICDVLMDIEQQLKRSYKNPQLLFSLLIERITAKNTP